MAVQLSVTSRNARLDAIETNIGTNPVLDFRTGSQPANCALANSGTQLGQITLPSDWLAVASSGSKAKLGTTSIITGQTVTVSTFILTDGNP